MAVDIPEIDGPHDHGLLRKLWFPFIMNQEAPFAVVLLLSASREAAAGGQTAKLELLRLRVQAVKCLQRALDDLQDTDSDHVIAAAAKFASYEAMYGENQSYNAHMKGLQKLINMRGGIKSLGLGGLLLRMVIWIDRNGAYMTGNKRFFTTDAEENEEPSIGQFLAMS